MSKPRWQLAPIGAVAVALATAAVAHGAAIPPAAPAGGTLEIPAKGVETLVLDGPRAGEQQTLNHPGPSVPLPPGRYTVRQIVLQGGVEGRPDVRPGAFPPIYQFSIALGQSHRLALGSGLTSAVTASRRGSVLRIDYTLTDGAGWKYTPRGRDNPPQVSFYRGDEPIGSGTFEYG